jgi:hypothetical protein
VDADRKKLDYFLRRAGIPEDRIEDESVRQFFRDQLQTTRILRVERFKAAFKKLLVKYPKHGMGSLTAHELNQFFDAYEDVLREEAVAMSSAARGARAVDRDRKIHDMCAKGVPRKKIAPKVKVSLATVSRVLSKPRP